MPVQKAIVIEGAPLKTSNVEPLLKILKLLNYSVRDLILCVPIESPKTISEYMTTDETGIATDRIREIGRNSDGISYAVKNPTALDAYRAYRLGLIDSVSFESDNNFDNIYFVSKDMKIGEIENFGSLDNRIKKLLRNA